MNKKNVMFIMTVAVFSLCSFFPAWAAERKIKLTVPSCSS